MQVFDRHEILDTDEIENLQAIRLKNTVHQATASNFYRNSLARANVKVPDINSHKDIARLPFTIKEDLREQYPFGFMAMPKDKMVRLHASSGTTGASTVILHTQNDLNVWADLVARSIHCAGVRSSDVFQNMSGYGLFTGGLGIHYGAERLGCLTIPAGAGNSKRQIKMLGDYKVSVAHIIPSYALHLGTVFDDLGVDPRSMHLRIMLIGAEPHSEEIRSRIQEIYGVKAYNSYGLSEMNGPGVAFECEYQAGMHLWEDAYLAEIIDPETLEPVPQGETGELVLTTLTREGMPILRYRTRDLTRFIPGQCPCGRRHRRIDRITGRSDDMIVIKGVNIYPMQVEKILMSIPEVGQNYIIQLERQGHMDQMRVKVEIRDEFFVEDMRRLQQLQNKIAGLLREEILISPRIDLVEHNTLPQSQGKATRVVDKREEEK